MLAYGYTGTASRTPSYSSLLGQRANAMARAYGVTPSAPRAAAPYNPYKPPLLPDSGDTRYADTYTPPASQQQSGGSSSSGGQRNYNWMNDPFLLETLANTGKSRAQAEQQKNDQLRKTILSSGIATLAEKLFPGDQAFIESVKNAPFSGMGQIKNAYEGVGGLVNQTNEALNKQNLWFGSYRTGVALPDVLRQRQGDEFSLTNQTQESVDSVNAAYANRLEQLAQQELQARQDAWMRAMQLGTDSGVGPNSSPYVDPNDPRLSNPQYGGISGMQVYEPYDFVRSSDIQYAVPGRGLPPGEPGWQRDGSGWIAPNGARLDENGRLR